jgi:hypothetical protein
LPILHPPVCGASQTVRKTFFAQHFRVNSQ